MIALTFETVVLDVLHRAGRGRAVCAHLHVVRRHDRGSIKIGQRAVAGFSVVVGRTALKVALRQTGLHARQPVRHLDPLALLSLQLETEHSLKGPAFGAFVLDVWMWRRKLNKQIRISERAGH